MSYEKPDEIPESQNDVYKTLHTVDIIRKLEKELNLIGLSMEDITYYKNEYCGDREQKCGCPHWFKIKITNLYKRIYEPNVWFFVCKRKRVYEIRFGHENGFSFVGENFWIDTKSFGRTQEKGKYIHSYGLEQVAHDIKIAHQAAEIKDYQSLQFDEFHSLIFKK